MALFFVAFFLIAGVGLLGIVHATLLDEFMRAVQAGARSSLVLTPACLTDRQTA